MKRQGESIVLSFDDVEVPREDWDAASFKDSRKAGLESLKQLLGEDDTNIIIVDDIMYLSSMRHEVYKLSRDRLVPLVVVHLDVSLSECLEGNLKRSEENRVDSEAIKRIYCSFERPNSANICDRLNITVEGREGMEKIATDILDIMRSTIQRRQEQLYAYARNTEEMLDPADSILSRAGELDLRLREVIGKIMRSTDSKTHLTKPALAAVLTKAKASFQETFRASNGEEEEAWGRFLLCVREGCGDDREIVAQVEQAIT